MKTDLRIAVVAPEDSAAAAAARKAGATLVGEDSIFTAVKAGRIEFDRCICHTDSLAKLNKAGLGRVLGPRGLMPSAKTGTVVKDVGASVRDMVGASEYRERLGVVRMAVGQLGYTPEELQRNIRAFVEKVRGDIAGLSDRISKDIHEVVSFCSYSADERIRRGMSSFVLTLTLGAELHQRARLESEWRLQGTELCPDKRLVHSVRILYIYPTAQRSVLFVFRPSVSEVQKNRAPFLEGSPASIKTTQTPLLSKLTNALFVHSRDPFPFHIFGSAPKKPEVTAVMSWCAMAVLGGSLNPPSLYSGPASSPNPLVPTLSASLASSKLNHLASSSSGSFPRSIFSPSPGTAWPIAPIIRFAGYGHGCVE